MAGRRFAVFGVPPDDCIMEVSLECRKVPGTGPLIFTLLPGDMTFADDCTM